MKRYFTHPRDDDLGGGIAYFEFSGDQATRQIEVYGGRWYCSDSPEDDPELGPGLVDQPPDVLELTDEHEISAEEFERLWRVASKSRAERTAAR